MGDNINGPSLIRVPDWLPNPLGRYYLYFAHHRGHYIRLAYADSLDGPWRTHAPGVLDLGNSYFEHHIASPDVLVDDDSRQLRLYFHGRLTQADKSGPHGRHGQATRAALSKDGLSFTAYPEILGAPYMRVFRYDGAHYGIAMPGLLYRSPHGLRDFEEGPALFPNTDQRHVGLRLVGDTIWIFHTNRGDCPEHILVSTMHLHGDWHDWRPPPPPPVLQPEHDWEGANQPHIPSRGGPIEVPAYQLRDPYVFSEPTQDYLLHAVAGEQGLALARLYL